MGIADPGRVAADPGRVAAVVLHAVVGCPQRGQACCGFPEVAFQCMRVKFRHSNAHPDAGSVAGPADLAADQVAEPSRPAKDLRFAYSVSHPCGEVRHKLGAGCALQVLSQSARCGAVTGILVEPQDVSLSFSGHAHPLRADSGIDDPDSERVTLPVAVADLHTA